MTVPEWAHAAGIRSAADEGGMAGIAHGWKPWVTRVNVTNDSMSTVCLA